MNFDVELLNGASSYNGVVKVFNNSKWYGVCNKHFNQGAAQVICRQLGYLYADHYESTIGSLGILYCKDDKKKCFR